MTIMNVTSQSRKLFKLYKSNICLTIRLITFISLKMTAPQQGISTEMSKVEPAGHEKN